MYRFLEYTVGQYMTHPVQTVTPDVPLWHRTHDLCGDTGRGG